MNSWHKKTVDEIVEKLGTKYSVEYPKNLPEQTREGALYQPDIVVFDRRINEVKYIIEVETANVRKSIAGATILAEICIDMLKQSFRPSLLFVVKDSTKEHELEKLNRRIEGIRNSLKKSSLEKVEIHRKKEFMTKANRL